MLPVQRVHCCPPHGKGCSGSHSRCRYQRRPDESRQGVVAEQGCSPLPPSRPRCFTTPWPLPMDAPRPPLTPKNSTAPSLPAGPGTSTEDDGAAAVPLQTPAPCRAGPAAGTRDRPVPSRPVPSHGHPEIFLHRTSNPGAPNRKPRLFPRPTPGVCAPPSALPSAWAPSRCPVAAAAPARCRPTAVQLPGTAPAPRASAGLSW